MVVKVVWLHKNREEGRNIQQHAMQNQHDCLNIIKCSINNKIIQSD